jgi:hypothetical protein
MSNETQALDPNTPVIAYARFLRELHRLTGEGKGDSDEAEAIAELMDAPWYAMTRQQQEPHARARSQSQCTAGRRSEATEEKR